MTLEIPSSLPVCVSFSLVAWQVIMLVLLSQGMLFTLDFSFTARVH